MNMAGSRTFIAACAVSAAMLLSPMAEAAKETFDRSKPHVNIGVSIGGIDFGDVVGLSGLGLTVPESDDTKAAPRFSNITLKRGYSGNTDLQDLVTKAAETGARCQDCRRDIKVSVLSRSGEAVRTFHLIDALPLSWSLGTSSSNMGEVVTEEVSFTYTRIITQ